MANDLENVELFASKICINELPERIVYHDISFTHRLIQAVKEISKEESIPPYDQELLVIAAWLYGTGFKDADLFEGKDIFKTCIACTQKVSKRFLHEIGFPDEKIKAIFDILNASTPPMVPKNITEKVFLDALFMDFARENGKKYVYKLYQELLLLGSVNSSKRKWNEDIIDFLNKHEYHTQYGQTILSPKKQELITKIAKENRSLIAQERDIIKRELNISDEELKKLKKELLETSNRDEKGIQTLFRTTSKNHYTINQMVDRKANIMISINAIIVSLLIGEIIGPSATLLQVKLLPVLTLAMASGLSMIYAVLAVRPDRSHGEFSEDEIRNKQGNLLYFGNFHNMKVRDYEWAFLQILNDKNYLYSSMIKDIYFLGQQIKKKHDNLRLSLNIFLVGTTISIIGFIIIKVQLI